MKINHVTENQDGDKVVFQGTLEGAELAFVLEYGLNMLMQQGALPFVSTDTIDEVSLMQIPDMEQ